MPYAAAPQNMPNVWTGYPKHYGEIGAGAHQHELINQVNDLEVPRMSFAEFRRMWGMYITVQRADKGEKEAKNCQKDIWANPDEPQLNGGFNIRLFTTMFTNMTLML